MITHNQIWLGLILDDQTDIKERRKEKKKPHPTQFYTEDVMYMCMC